MTPTYIEVFIVLTIAANIMYLLSFIVRKNDPKAGSEWLGLAKLFREAVE